MFELGHTDEARTRFEQAVRLAPDTALFWNNLGSLLRQQGQWLEAEQNLLKALALDPNEPLVRINLGLLYLSLDRPDLALPHLEAARQLMPPDQIVRVQTLIDQANQPEAWLRMVNYWLSQNDPIVATPALSQAARPGTAPM